MPLKTAIVPSGDIVDALNQLNAILAVLNGGNPATAASVTAAVAPLVTTVAALPAAAANQGKLAVVTDALTPTVGSAVAAGGAAIALVWSNGTTWKVAAT